jgi:hypothetical protein
MKKGKPRDGIAEIEQLARSMILVGLAQRQQLLDTQTRRLPDHLPKSA